MSPILLLLLLVSDPTDPVVRVGETVEGRLEEGQLARYRLEASDATAVTVSVHSLWVDPDLAALDADGEVLAASNEGWYLTHARLDLPPIGPSLCTEER